MTEQRRKLIEVALPLEVINRALKAEKDRKVGKPQQVHHWWARRPITAARVVLFAQLVDDPSSRANEFATVVEQDRERGRLFSIIERLCAWEAAWDDKLLAEARQEIDRCSDGQLPTIFDPFAGGGSIPLEAQRLGLAVHASDLNPVAVLINKALIELPPKRFGRPPVFPGAAIGAVDHWPYASGLAEDVRRYGGWMREEARSRIGALYPDAALPNGKAATVISWIWARTVTCRNPACGIDMPLLRSFWLSKKSGHKVWLEPLVGPRTVKFTVRTGTRASGPDGTVGRTGAVCLGCQSPVDLEYIRVQGRTYGLGAQLVAIVAEGDRKRIYLPAEEAHAKAAEVLVPTDVPDTELPEKALSFRVQAYGMARHRDLFTNRQLVAMSTFSKLVGEARTRIERDACAAGLTPDEALASANAIATYLALAVSRLADWSNSLCRWESSGQVSQQLFNRQSVPMVWDFSESGVLGSSSGSFSACIENVARAVSKLTGGPSAVVDQADASKLTMPPNAVVCTDPPYYDNIGYADLADFFYVWLRQALADIYPDITATVLTPKVEELVATPYRFGGSKARAKEHFEQGFINTFSRIREKHSGDFPITVFYAFKQAEEDDGGTASTGWETMLNGLIEAGFSITATWPMRTEMASRMIGRGANALSSSIVLACRQRAVNAEATTLRGFIAALKDQLPRALRELQQGSVAPVDLAQAAIGPGMAVFTNFSRVVEADGADMTVRTALALINQVLDETLSEQEGDFDADTRFCVKWFSQYAWDETDSGTADVLARATNTSIAGLQRGGVFRAVAGKARLLSPDDLSDSWDPSTDLRTSVWEVALHLAKAVSERGSAAAAELMTAAGQRVDLDIVKELAYLLYNVSERKGWTSAALLFNGLGTSWIDLDAASRASAGKPKPVADTLTFDQEG